MELRQQPVNLKDFRKAQQKTFNEFSNAQKAIDKLNLPEEDANAVSAVLQTALNNKLKTLLETPIDTKRQKEAAKEGVSVDPLDAAVEKAGEAAEMIS